MRKEMFVALALLAPLARHLFRRMDREHLGGALGLIAFRVPVHLTQLLPDRLVGSEQHQYHGVGPEDGCAALIHQGGCAGHRPELAPGQAGWNGVGQRDRE